MITLFHHPLCPFSRKVRLLLEEGGFSYTCSQEPFWQKREEFLDLNPFGEIPVLYFDREPLTQSQAITEYLISLPSFNGPSLSAKSQKTAFEIRKLCLIADTSLYQKSTAKLLYEKYFKRQMGLGGPDSRVIRAALNHLEQALEVYSWRLERNNWLAGNDLSLADFTTAAHLSCLDYLGLMPWEHHPDLKSWYMCLKSRPSFTPLLEDKIAGLTPAPHYTNLDF